MAFVAVVLFYFILFFFTFTSNELLVPHSSQRGGKWRMTKPLISSSVANALAECYKNGGDLGSRRETLSIRDGPTEESWVGEGGNFCAAEFFCFMKFLHEFQF